MPFALGVLRLLHDLCVWGQEYHQMMLCSFQGIVLGGTWHPFVSWLVNRGRLLPKDLKSYTEKKDYESLEFCPEQQTLLCPEQSCQAEATPGLKGEWCRWKGIRTRTGCVCQDTLEGENLSGWKEIFNQRFEEEGRTPQRCPHTAGKELDVR